MKKRTKTFGYADPPYPGQARKHYAADPLCAEVDHADLISSLVREYPDGWALSTSTTALKAVLAVAPDGVRIGAWVKPFCSFKPNVNPAYSWEPVLFMGGRKRPRTDLTIRDWVSCNITQRRGLAGAKPRGFCFWVFALLGAQPQDHLVDIYPGSGAVSSSWDCFRRQGKLF